MFKVNYAKPIDAIILGDIHSKSWKYAYKNIIPDETLNNITKEKRAEHFEKAIKLGWEEDAILYIDDNPVGLIGMGQSRDCDLDRTYGEIKGIYILPEYWEMGVGSELLNWAIKELKYKGYSNISLWVLEDNLRAINFYEKYGFNCDKSRKEIFIGKKLIERRYIKKL